MYTGVQFFRGHGVDNASLVMLSMKYKMVHAATVQAFSIGSLLTTLPIIRQHGFDMAFIVSWRSSVLLYIHTYIHTD